MLTEDMIQQWVEAAGLSKLWPDFGSYLAPSIRLVTQMVDDEATVAVGASKLGGSPDLPAGFEWPHWEDFPLSFLGQIDLAEASAVDQQGLLPSSGRLYFFVDSDGPSLELDDTDSWRVIYDDSAPGELTRTPFPGEVDEDGAGLAKVYKTAEVSFAPETTVPSTDSLAFARLDAEADVDNLWGIYVDDIQGPAFEEAQDFGPLHRMLGHADILQRDMGAEIEEHLTGELSDEEAAERAMQWRLLLQVDSDWHQDFDWGDGGILYFWIREGDLREAKFDGVYAFTQAD